MNDLTIRRIAQQYFESLPNKDVTHARTVILFSGMVASGKTTIAKEIEKQLSAVRLSNDELRKRIVAVKPTISLKEREAAKLIAAAVLFEMVLGIANGLIVIDASCDRSEGNYKAWTDKNGYKTILLRLEVEHDEIIRRLRERSDQDYRKTDRLLSMVDRWWDNWVEFGKQHQPDMTVTSETKINEIVDTLSNKISQ